MTELYFGALGRKEQSHFLKQQVDEAIQKGAKSINGWKSLISRERDFILSQLFW